jgi:hypothetical protein
VPRKPPERAEAECEYDERDMSPKAHGGFEPKRTVTVARWQRSLPALDP